MIKKIAPFIFAILLFTHLAAYEGTIEVRGASFFPVGGKFREVYTDVAPSYQIEASLACGYVDLWSNIDWVPKKDIRSCSRTKTDITQASCGIKYYFPLSEQASCYLGIGPSCGKIVIHNQTCCFTESHSRFAIGVVFKSGVQISLTNKLFADAFLDYLCQSIHFRKNVNIGGVKMGLGFGLRF